MKKIVALTLVVLVPLAAVWVYASHPWLGKTLNAEEVKRRWGAETFEETAFKSGDKLVKAKMAYSLITSEKMRGLSPSEVRSRLGDFDGHYFSESYPTYIIQEAQKPGEDTWQLVFLIDRNRKTKNVIVHKNCCD